MTKGAYLIPVKTHVITNAKLVRNAKVPGRNRGMGAKLTFGAGEIGVVAPSVSNSLGGQIHKALVTDIIAADFRKYWTIFIQIFHAGCNRLGEWRMP